MGEISVTLMVDSVLTGTWSSMRKADTDARRELRVVMRLDRADTDNFSLTINEKLDGAVVWFRVYTLADDSRI